MANLELQNIDINQDKIISSAELEGILVLIENDEVDNAGQLDELTTNLINNIGEYDFKISDELLVKNTLSKQEKTIVNLYSQLLDAKIGKSIENNLNKKFNYIDQDLILSSFTITNLKQKKQFFEELKESKVENKNLVIINNLHNLWLETKDANLEKKIINEANSITESYISDIEQRDFIAGTYKYSADEIAVIQFLANIQGAEIVTNGQRAHVNVKTKKGYIKIPTTNENHYKLSTNKNTFNKDALTTSLWVFRQELLWMFAESTESGDNKPSIFFEEELDRLDDQTQKDLVLSTFANKFSKLSKRGPYFWSVYKEGLKGYFTELTDLAKAGKDLKGADKIFQNIKFEADLFLDDDKRKRVINFVDQINSNKEFEASDKGQIDQIKNIIKWIQKNPKQINIKKLLYKKLNTDFTYSQISELFPETKNDILKYREYKKRNKIELSGGTRLETINGVQLPVFSLLRFGQDEIGKEKQSRSKTTMLDLVGRLESNFYNQYITEKKRLESRYSRKDDDVKQDRMDLGLYTFGLKKYMEKRDKAASKYRTNLEGEELNKAQYYFKTQQKIISDIFTENPEIKDHLVQYGEYNKQLVGAYRGAGFEASDGKIDKAKLKNSRGSYEKYIKETEKIKQKHNYTELEKEIGIYLDKKMEDITDIGELAKVFEVKEKYNKYSKDIGGLQKKFNASGDRKKIKDYLSLMQMIQNVESKFPNLEKIKKSKAIFTKKVNMSMSEDKRKKAATYGAYLGNLQESGLASHLNDIGTTSNILNTLIGENSIFTHIANDAKEKIEYQKEVEAYYGARKKNSPTMYGITNFGIGVWNELIDGTIGVGSSLGIMIESLYESDAELQGSIEYKEKRDNSFKFAVSDETNEAMVVDGKLNMNISNVTGQVGAQMMNMLLLIGGGAEVSGGLKALGSGSNIAGKAGLFTSSLFMTVGNHYEEALRQNMSRGDAFSYAMIQSLSTSALELISPNNVILGRFKLGGANLLKAGSKKKLMSLLVKGYVKELGGETLQEITQTLAEKGLNYLTNENFETAFSAEVTRDELASIAILTGITTGIVSSKGIVTQANIQNKQELDNLIQKMGKEEVVKQLNKIKQINKLNNESSQELNDEQISAMKDYVNSINHIETIDNSETTINTGTYTKTPLQSIDQSNYKTQSGKSIQENFDAKLNDPNAEIPMKDGKPEYVYNNTEVSVGNTRAGFIGTMKFLGQQLSGKSRILKTPFNFSTDKKIPGDADVCMDPQGFKSSLKNIIEQSQENAGKELNEIQNGIGGLYFMDTSGSSRSKIENIPENQGKINNLIQNGTIKVGFHYFTDGVGVDVEIFSEIGKTSFDIMGNNKLNNMIPLTLEGVQINTMTPESYQGYVENLLADDFTKELSDTKIEKLKVAKRIKDYTETLGIIASADKQKGRPWIKQTLTNFISKIFKLNGANSGSLIDALKNSTLLKDSGNVERLDTMEASRLAHKSETGTGTEKPPSFNDFMNKTGALKKAIKLELNKTPIDQAKLQALKTQIQTDFGKYDYKGEKNFHLYNEYYLLNEVYGKKIDDLVVIKNNIRTTTNLTMKDFTILTKKNVSLPKGVVYDMIISNSHSMELKNIVKILSKNNLTAGYISFFPHDVNGTVGQSRMIHDQATNDHLIHEVSVSTAHIEYGISLFSKESNPEIERRSDEVIFETTIHELLHTYTSFIFNNDNAILRSNEKKYKKTMEGLYEKYMSIHKTGDKEVDSINEFVVRIMTNKAFIQKAKDTPYGKSNIYQEAFQAYEEYLGDLNRQFSSQAKDGAPVFNSTNHYNFTPAQRQKRSTTLDNITKNAKGEYETNNDIANQAFTDIQTLILEKTGKEVAFTDAQKQAIIKAHLEIKTGNNVEKGKSLRNVGLDADVVRVLMESNVCGRIDDVMNEFMTELNNVGLEEKQSNETIITTPHQGYINYVKTEVTNETLDARGEIYTFQNKNDFVDFMNENEEHFEAKYGINVTLFEELTKNAFNYGAKNNQVSFTIKKVGDNYEFDMYGLAKTTDINQLNEGLDVAKFKADLANNITPYEAKLLQIISMNLKNSGEKAINLLSDRGINGLKTDKIKELALDIISGHTSLRRKLSKETGIDGTDISGLAARFAEDVKVYGFKRTNTDTQDGAGNGIMKLRSESGGTISYDVIPLADGANITVAKLIIDGNKLDKKSKKYREKIDYNYEVQTNFDSKFDPDVCELPIKDGKHEYILKKDGVPMSRDELTTLEQKEKTIEIYDKSVEQDVKLFGNLKYVNKTGYAFNNDKKVPGDLDYATNAENIKPILRNLIQTQKDGSIENLIITDKIKNEIVYFQGSEVNLNDPAFVKKLDEIIEDRSIRIEYDGLVDLGNGQQGSMNREIFVENGKGKFEVDISEMIMVDVNGTIMPFLTKKGYLKYVEDLLLSDYLKEVGTGEKKFKVAKRFKDLIDTVKKLHKGTTASDTDLIILGLGDAITKRQAELKTETNTERITNLKKDIAGFNEILNKTKEVIEEYNSYNHGVESPGESIGDFMTETGFIKAISLEFSIKDINSKTINDVLLARFIQEELLKGTVLVGEELKLKMEDIKGNLENYIETYKAWMLKSYNSGKARLDEMDFRGEAGFALFFDYYNTKKNLKYDVHRNHKYMSEMYNKFPKLKEYESFLKEQKMWGQEIRVFGSGVSGVVISGPHSDVVIKIPFSEIEKTEQITESRMHELFSRNIQEGHEFGKVPKNIKISEVRAIPNKNNPYYVMEKIEGQSVYTKYLVAKYNLGEVETSMLTDAEVKTLLETKGLITENDPLMERPRLSALDQDILAQVLTKQQMTDLKTTEEYLVEKGLSHADLHAGNIMMDNNGTDLYIIDFGITEIDSNAFMQGFHEEFSKLADKADLESGEGINTFIEELLPIFNIEKDVLNKELRIKRRLKSLIREYHKNNDVDYREDTMTEIKEELINIATSIG